MSCEEEYARVEQAGYIASQRGQYASYICVSRGADSIDCRNAQNQMEAALAEFNAAKEALAECRREHPQPPDRLLSATGFVTFLRVNEPGGGYGGGSTNWFDADVIFKLHSRPDKGFGFRLRKDDGEPVRRGMLALLENALVHRLQVITDYVELGEAPNDNSFVIRVAVTQTPPSRPPSTPENISEVMG